MRQHSPSGHVPSSHVPSSHALSGYVGRHRRQFRRGRTTVAMTALTAVLAVAAGAASVAASASPPGTARDGRRLPTAAHAPAAWPIVPPAGDDAPGKRHPRLDPLPKTRVRAASPVRRKPAWLNPARLNPARLKPAAGWVHPTPTAWLTSCFGPRWGRLHAGIDLAAPLGTPILAAGAGMVVAAGPNGGYGNAVLIDHRDGWLTHYAHMQTILVRAGQVLAAGAPVGEVGSTGHSTGPHLHFEVHRGYFQNPVEPTAWMRAHGVPIPGCENPAPTVSRSEHAGGSATSPDRRSRSAPASPVPAPPPPAPGPSRSADGSPGHPDRPSAPASSHSPS